MFSRGFVSRHRRHRPGANQRGQVLLILVLVVPVLFGFVGLAVDGGLANINQRRAQTAADAASLDAAQLIAAPATPAVAPSALVFVRARDVAAANGFPAFITCSQTSPPTAGGQNVYVYSDACAGTNATGKNRVTVKIPPDAALIDPDSDCAANGGANAYQCVQVTIQYNYQTQFEKIFGFNQVLVAANASAYNSTQPPTAGATSVPTTPNSVCGPGLGGGRDESAQLVDNYTNKFHGAPGEGSEEYGGPTKKTPPQDPNMPAPATWVGVINPPVPPPAVALPTPVILSAPTLVAGRWVWKVGVADEWGIDAYQLAFYFGQGPTTTVHYFSQGIWLKQPVNFSTQPPVPNSSGASTGVGQNPAVPGPTGKYAAYPNLAQAVSSPIHYFPLRPSSGSASGAGFFNDWQASGWPDGSTVEVWGYNWTFGAGSTGTGLTYGGNPGGVSTVTFSMPQNQWLNPQTKLPFGAATPPPMSLYLQDGDRCGDEGLYVTPAVTQPPQPNPGPNLLEG